MTSIICKLPNVPISRWWNFTVCTRFPPQIQKILKGNPGANGCVWSCCGLLGKLQSVQSRLCLGTSAANRSVNHGKPKPVTDCCCGFFVSLADSLSLWPGTHSHSRRHKSCDHICFWITVSAWVLFPRCAPAPALQHTPTRTSLENQITCPISSAVRHYPSAQDPGPKPELLYFENQQSVCFPLWIDVAQQT